VSFVASFLEHSVDSDHMLLNTKLKYEEKMKLGLHL